ncbi:MAG: polysaccharide biosynthesis/export family protein [Bacteroidota bacterium]
MYKLNYLLLLSGLLLCLNACQTPQLFQTKEQTDSSVLSYFAQSPPAPVLKKGDKITLSIWQHDQLSIGSINTVYNTDEMTGRWVIIDKEGEVNLPKIGRAKIEGYTIKEAAYYLEALYSKHIKSPVINLRVLNHFVTVIGEVNAPSRYNLDNETIRLVDLIAEAGGLTEYAEAKDVRLIREINGQLLSMSIDMTSLLEMKTKNAILLPEDVIYIPSRSKKGSDEFLAKAVPITSILTGFAVFFSVFAK